MKNEEKQETRNGLSCWYDASRGGYKLIFLLSFHIHIALLGVSNLHSVSSCFINNLNCGLALVFVMIDMIMAMYCVPDISITNLGVVAGVRRTSDAGDAGHAAH